MHHSAVRCVCLAWLTLATAACSSKPATAPSLTTTPESIGPVAGTRSSGYTHVATTETTAPLSEPGRQPTTTLVTAAPSRGFTTVTLTVAPNSRSIPGTFPPTTPITATPSDSTTATMAPNSPSSLGDPLSTVTSAPSGSPQPKASFKNVVYWGQNGEGRLSEYCNRDKAGIDVIALAFLYSFGGQDKPVVPNGHFGKCRISDKGEAENCDELAQDIKSCAAKGVQVLLSLGGTAGSYSVPSVTSALYIGQYLWDAYGPPSPNSKVARPFGDAVVSGWDFVIEQGGPSNNYYQYMIKKLRSNFPQNSNFKITGAPQCILPNANMDDMIQHARFDHLFVQFYNNPGCSKGDFNYDEWKRHISGTSSSEAQIFVGVPASDRAATDDMERARKFYLTPSELEVETRNIRNDEAFGGIMMWSAGWSDKNRDGDRTYAKRVKCALGWDRCGKADTAG